jgi:hypothetical protein
MQAICFSFYCERAISRKFNNGRFANEHLHFGPGTHIAIADVKPNQTEVPIEKRDRSNRPRPRDDSGQCRYLEVRNSLSGSSVSGGPVQRAREAPSSRSSQETDGRHADASCARSNSAEACDASGSSSTQTRDASDNGAAQGSRDASCAVDASACRRSAVICKQQRLALAAGSDCAIDDRRNLDANGQGGQWRSG